MTDAVRRGPGSGGRSARRTATAIVAAVGIALAAGCGSGGDGAGTDGPAGAPAASDTVPAGAPTGADDPSPPGPAAASTDASAAADTAAAGDAGVPTGGLEAWISDMRTRLEEVELDPRTSYDEVLRLYTTRHGLIERYYGAGGVITGDDHPELAEAVHQQDEAFQELLELTGTTHYIERTHLLHAIRNIRMTMERILDEAREAGVPLDPLRRSEGADR